MFFRIKSLSNQAPPNPIEQSICIPPIGDITFVSGIRAKHVRISVRPFGKIRVVVPKGIPIQKAIAFVELKRDWILRTKERMEQHEQSKIVFTTSTVFSTHSRSLHLIAWKSGRFHVQLTRDSLNIFYPQTIDLISESSQKTIKHYIIETLRKEAKMYLPQRTEQLAKMHGFTYHGVTVKNTISRWGSCSTSNHINLNIHLMRLPQHLSDYVILHELAHTIHKNHGPKFWQCLNEHTHDCAKQLAAEIKQRSIDF